jgi:hypothetical protein
MKRTTDEISSRHDKTFKKIFKNVKNAKDFLKKVLPPQIKQRLDFRYILFDTNPWDFRDESNQELKDNVMLLK